MFMIVIENYYLRNLNFPTEKCSYFPVIGPFPLAKWFKLWAAKIIFPY